MDINNIIDALRSTTIAEGQSEASEYLKKVSSLIGFPQILLQIIQDAQLDCSVRQAAVIYMKNVIYEHWEVDKDHSDEKQWELSEQDKAPLRHQIIQAIIHSPEPIKVHLCTTIQSIMRHDFPEKWPGLTVELFPLLNSQESEILMGALLILHRLCKIYEYKRQKEKTPIVDFMCRALPILRERLSTLLKNETSASYFVQKQILKIFYSLIQFSLNLQMLPIEEYAKWLTNFMDILQKRVPSECDSVPEDERSETIYWKCKKWALKIIQRMFERYGNKGNVDKPYVGFAEEYSKNYALPVIVESLMLHILNNYIDGKFVSDYVIYLTLNHLSDALNQAQVWQIIKPKLDTLIKKIIFPLLQHSNEDEDLWNDDVEEYLRYKYDVYEDLHQPSSAASTLLQMISKRQGIMQQILEFIIHNLSPTSTAHQIDGALHMIAVISSQLLKSKKYKKDIEKLIDAHVTNRTTHEVRFVRMRACYVLHYASETSYKNSKILERVVNALVQRLKEDCELPVKVEAAIAIQSILNDQNLKAVQLLKPHIRDVIIIVLRLVAETHLDDLPAVVDTLIENFEEDVIPIAYEITLELVNIFNKMVTGEAADDDVAVGEEHTVGVMGILATLETILDLVEEHGEIIKKIEPVVRGCILSIFECYCENYFEEALSLTHTLIQVHISPEMWQVYDLVYKTFIEEDTCFFSDCMPVLHAFVIKDTGTFLASQERVQKLLTMCEKTMNDNDCDENTKSHAAKMIEVFILQCQGNIDSLIPSILQLVFNQLRKPVNEQTSLNCYKPQLLMVLISTLYSNFQLCANFFGQIRIDAQSNTFEWFLQELYKNRENIEGIHDRKMVIWIICRLLSDGIIPAIFHNQIDKFMGWVLTLFDELQRCMKELADRSKEEDSDDDDESSDADDERMNEELKDSDDDVDAENMEYLEALQLEKNLRHQRRSRRKSSTNKSMEDQTENIFGKNDSTEGSDSEDYQDFQEETDLEAFTTILDEEEDKPGLNVFVLFKHTIEVLKEQNLTIFNALCGEQYLNSEKLTKLKALMEICAREENLQKSKQLAQTGGYAFDAAQSVPNSFNFA